MKSNILVVDDNAVTNILIKQNLQQAGYEVFSAENGIKALDILKSINIDLIITDIIMPEMDGVDLYKALKNKERTKNLPIIVITDNRMFRESFASLGGVDDFLTKPLNAQELISKVKNVLNLVSKQRKPLKAIILGNSKEVCSRMSQQLEQMGCKPMIVKTSIELIENSLLMIPDIILVDVLMKDLPTRETIRSLRCFVKLNNTKILAYTNFSPDELGDVETVESLKDAKNACIEAGATKYIGRYAQPTFSQNFYEYIK